MEMTGDHAEVVDASGDHRENDPWDQNCEYVSNMDNNMDNNDNYELKGEGDLDCGQTKHNPDNMYDTDPGCQDQMVDYTEEANDGSQNQHGNVDTHWRTFSDVLNDLAQESSLGIHQYSQPCAESEDYELQASAAVSDLDAHTKVLLGMLQSQKDQLCDHLTSITQGLKTDI